MDHFLELLIIFSAKYLLFVSAVIAIIYFLKQSRQRQKEILVFALILFPLSYIIAKILGHFFYDPRPFAIENFMPLIPHAADNGFPSDHTLLGAAIAFAVFRFNKKLGLFLLVLAILVGLARILAGVHHAADIAGSILIVTLISLSTNFLYFARRKDSK